MSADAVPTDVIAQCAAEVLALPQRVCRARSCRRDGRCSWVEKDTGAPTCLQHLDAGQRLLFDAVCDRVRTVTGHELTPLMLSPPDDPDPTSLDQAALEIFLQLAPVGVRRKMEAMAARARAALTARAKAAAGAGPASGSGPASGPASEFGSGQKITGRADVGK